MCASRDILFLCGALSRKRRLPRGAALCVFKLVGIRMILNYIGSKVRLLPAISRVIEPLIEECCKNNDGVGVCVGDLFAGTGVVGAAFAKHPRVSRVVANDQELYSFIINNALLNCVYTPKLEKIIKHLNGACLKCVSGLITRHFSPFQGCDRMFFTVENARRIDGMRIAIQSLYDVRKINTQEYYFLLASLFCACSRYSNTASCFRAYLKTYSERSKRTLKLLPVHKNTYRRGGVECVIKRSNVLEALKDAECGGINIAYLDPPYSSSHYGSYYSFFNYLALYDPGTEIYGVAGVLRDYNKSTFGIKLTAKASLNELMHKLADLKTVKYVVLSYNEDGVLKEDEITSILKRYGSVVTYKVWNKKFKPNKLVTGDKVKDFIMVVAMDEKGNSFGGVRDVWLE